MCLYVMCFFSNAALFSEIYTLSLHDALPISAPFELDGVDGRHMMRHFDALAEGLAQDIHAPLGERVEVTRSEEHTSELHSRQYLVCRLLLETINRYSLLYSV